MEIEECRQLIHALPGEIGFVENENLSAPLRVPFERVGEIRMHLSGSLYPGLQQDDEVLICRREIMHITGSREGDWNCRLNIAFDPQPPDHRLRSGETQIPKRTVGINTRMCQKWHVCKIVAERLDATGRERAWIDRNRRSCFP